MIVSNEVEIVELTLHYITELCTMSTQKWAFFFAQVTAIEVVGSPYLLLH
jgi:hypothetical protein